MITFQQALLFAILILTMVLFVVGRWRYDVVALLALLATTLVGLVPMEGAFSGFSNPAVITVAAVLVLSRGLQNSGLVDLIGQRLERVRGGITVQLAVLTLVVAALSAFMNNVGALALLLPVALSLAHKKGISPSKLLMPLAFASLLGGMTTLIGTPPNIIASAFRQQATGTTFGMFDFSPVGLGVAAAGLLVIVLLGWRLIPARVERSVSENLFDIENYITEVRLPEKSALNGKRLREADIFARLEINIVGLVRDGERRLEPSALTGLRSNDILMLSANAQNIQKLVESGDVELVGSQKIGSSDLVSEDVRLVEAVVMPNSQMIGGTARSLNLRAEYGVNLLAVSRQGRLLRSRLDRIRLRNGDVLLLQSHVETSREIIETLGCLPLAGRGLRLGQPPRVAAAVGIFGAALLVTAFGLLPAQVSFLAAVVVMIFAKILSLREAYEAVDWPIIILLGAMIPVGEALQTSGGAQLIAGSLLRLADYTAPVVTLAIALLATMFLSDVINNAAAVVLMAPIGISVANGLGVSVDPFLIAIAIGASCAFLTPIGHQSNTLVMGPGGYKFGDYWRIGLLVEAAVAATAVPLIMIFWPF